MKKLLLIIPMLILMTTISTYAEDGQFKVDCDKGDPEFIICIVTDTKNDSQFLMIKGNSFGECSLGLTPMPKNPHGDKK